MRPGQNKRMRGRNNNRKGPNPLTRSYESNGPDVKVRGTAQHVAEKYLQLARDAQSSGDPVMAENYLQHAEHYFRLIAAAIQQQQQQLAYGRPPSESAEPDEVDDDDESDIPDRFASPFERQQPNQSQIPPNFTNQPQPFTDRPPHGDRQPHQQHERGPRQERQERHNVQPRDFRDHRQSRDRNFNNQRPAPTAAETPPQEDAQPVAALPAFITGARAVSADAQSPTAQPTVAASFEGEHENANFHLRNRRRRRPRSMGEGGGSENSGNESSMPGEVPAGQ